MVLDGDDVTAWKSFRNLTDVHILEAGQLNAYDVLVSDVVVFTRSTLPVGRRRGAGPPEGGTVDRRTPGPAAAAPTEPTTRCHGG